MYSLRFDDGVTSAGFLLTPRGLASLNAQHGADAASLWRALLGRYPTLEDAFAEATPLMPVAFRSRIQHRLTRAAGERWALMPHAFAFVDPLFSTGIAWSLRAIERLALAFESAAHDRRLPDLRVLERYDKALAAEADQIDLVVAGAYEAMAHFDLFAAHAMLYFATVSFAEASQRLKPTPTAAWNGFLGVGDPVLEPLPKEALRRLREKSRSVAGRSARLASARAFQNGLPDRSPAQHRGLGECRAAESLSRGFRGAHRTARAPRNESRSGCRGLASAARNDLLARILVLTVRISR